MRPWVQGWSEFHKVLIILVSTKKKIQDPHSYDQRETYSILHMQLTSWSVDYPEQLEIVPVIQKGIKNWIPFPPTGVYQKAALKS